MSDFFGTLVVLGVVFLIAFGAYSAGKTSGRKKAWAGLRAVSAAGDRDDPYRAGYLAGHLAGWRDADAQFRAPYGAPGPVQASPVQARPPQPGPAPWSPGQQPRPFPFPQPQPQTERRQPAPVPPSPQRQISKEDGAAAQAMRKERRDRQNINVTLYVAGLLLVAAAALFVGTGLPVAFRLAGVWVVTALFYLAGFVLHARAPRLRPAAVAFAGTGLALIPVAGLATYNFGSVSGPTAWLATSLIGTVAYLAAAVRLGSSVLAYLSLSFVVSTAWSGISMLGGALVWYFAALIGIAVLLTLLAMLRPRWLPPVYVRPLIVLHPLVVPAVAVASTLTAGNLGAGEYPLILAVSGTYFGVMAGIPTSRYRVLYFYCARAAFTAAAMAAVADADGGLSGILLTALLALAIQSVVVAFGTAVLSRWFPGSGEPGTDPRWRGDAAVTFGLQLLAGLLLALDIALRPSDVPLPLPFFVALAISMLLAWKLRGGAEWLVAASLILSAPFAERLGGWPMAVLLGGAAVYWLARALARGQGWRQHFVLAARAAGTLALASVAAAVVPDDPNRAAIVLTVFVVAASSQLLLQAGLNRAEIATFAPNASLVAFGAAGLAGLPFVLVADDSAGQQFTVIAIVVEVFAAVIAGWMAFPWAGGKTPWEATAAEVLAPTVVLCAAALAFGGVSLSCGNAVLLAGVGYLVAQGLRLSPSTHRNGYWWGARAMGTVLACTGYAELLREGYGISFAGEELRVGTVLLLVLALQLLLPLAKALRIGMTPRGDTSNTETSGGGTRNGDSTQPTVDAAVVLLFMAGTAAALCLLTSGFDYYDPNGGWQPGFAVMLTAASAAVSGYILRSDEASAFFAPSAFVLVMALRAGHIHEVEALLGIFAAFCAAMAVTSGDRVARGSYFVGARVLTAALAVVFAHDVTASATVVSLTFSVVLALQLAIRWLMRNRMQNMPYQQAAVWVTLAGQSVLPVAYLMQDNINDGGRWVVLLELLMLVVSAAIAYRFFSARGAQFLAIPATAALLIAAGPGLLFARGTWLSEPLLSEDSVPLLLLVLALLVTAARAFGSHALGLLGKSLRGHPGPAERWFWLTAALVFTVVGGVVGLDASLSVAGLAGIVLAVVCFAASRVEDLQGFYPLGAAAALLGSTALVDGLLDEIPDPWGDFLPWLIGSGGAGLLLYAWRWLRFSQPEGTGLGRVSLVAAGGLGPLVAAAAGLVRDGTALVGAVLLAIAVAVAVLESRRGARWATSEVGTVFVLAAVQRAILFPDDASPNVFWVVQWYVVLCAVLAGLRYVLGRVAAGRVRLIAAAALLSFSGLGTVVSGTVPQQLWVLVGCAVLLASGLVLGDRLFVWWGAIGIGISIMWASRSYAFAMLALLALALIAFAIWRLNRTRPAVGEPAAATEAADRRGSPGP